jgi:hypothetical protein
MSTTCHKTKKVNSERTGEFTAEKERQRARAKEGGNKSLMSPTYQKTKKSKLRKDRGVYCRKGKAKS